MQMRFLKIFVILLACSVLTSSIGMSQTRNDLIRALEQLNRDLERVRELVLSFDNLRAKQLVDAAQKLRNEAVSVIEHREFSVAAAKIKMANGLLEQAVKITLDKPVHRLQRRLEELMRQADHIVLGSHHKEAERILREAKSNQEAGKKAFGAHNFKRAVEHLRVAITLTERSIKLVQRSVDFVTDKFIEQKRRFESLRTRAQEIVEQSHDRRSKQIFHQAMKLASSAEEAFRNRNFELAQKFYNQSVLLLLRSMDIASGVSPTVVDRSKIALNRLTHLIEDSRETIAKSNRPRARKLLERAMRFKREAELALTEGRSYKALWKIDLAENMIQKALRIAKGRIASHFTNKISQEIENTEKDIAEFQKGMIQGSPRDVDVLINMSKSAINRAERAYAAGYNRLALENVLASQRFLSKAERIVKYQEQPTLSKAMIAVRLNQLNEAIEKAEENVAESKQDWNRRLIQSAKEIRTIAVKSFQNGNYRAADEGIQVAFEIIRKSLKNLPQN